MPDFNLMENKILNMLAEKRESLKLIWVPTYIGKVGNKAADKATKYPLNEDFLPGPKATEECSKESTKALKKSVQNHFFLPYILSVHNAASFGHRTLFLHSMLQFVAIYSVQKSSLSTLFCLLLDIV
jgi:hypothetical protein